MSFSKQSFSNRFRTMGDQAEQAFAQMMAQTDSTYETFGWRRPSTGMSKMTAMLRFAPDFYTGKGWLVEVMGCGRDGVLKGLKVPKWAAMCEWNHVQRVGFWLWNSHLGEGVWLDIFEMEGLVERSVSEFGIERFEVDGNEFHPLPWLWLKDAADA